MTSVMPMPAERHDRARHGAPVSLARGRHVMDAAAAESGGEGLVALRPRTSVPGPPGPFSKTTVRQCDGLSGEG